MLYLCSSFVEFYIFHNNKLYNIGSGLQIRRLRHHAPAPTAHASEGRHSYSRSLLPQPLIYGLKQLHQNEKNLIPYIWFKKTRVQV
jgi:hypothetical protein